MYDFLFAMSKSKSQLLFLRLNFTIQPIKSNPSSALTLYSRLLPRLRDLGPLLLLPLRSFCLLNSRRFSPRRSRLVSTTLTPFLGPSSRMRPRILTSNSSSTLISSIRAIISSERRCHTVCFPLVSCLHTADGIRLMRIVLLCYFPHLDWAFASL